MKIEEKSAIVAILINLILGVVLGPYGSDRDGKDVYQQIKNLIYISNKNIFTTSLLLAIIVYSSIYISNEFKIINRLL
tara:strand:- start:2482 stop:2715 length:234 start_codon:yes stop_codon:yes gene_type:complete